MVICKIGGLLLRHFSIVSNGTTATAAVRSHFVRFKKRDQTRVSRDCEITSNFNETLKQSNKNFPF